MSSDVLLDLRDAAKTYPQRRRPGRELWSRLIGTGPAADHRHALQPVTLQVRRGETVGIVGLNGAGKSTLLQMAAGVLSPSSGSVAIRGRVAALLELGSGFDPEATGLENIHLYATTLGLTAAEVQARLDDIIDFSGLRASLQSPVKTYSSGMQVRLAFSVATAVQPDILIVDEALSVGDGAFAKRSFDRIMALRERGTALLLSSHALFHVDLFCTRTLWLHQGAVRAWGDTKQVVPAYQEFLDSLAQSDGTAPVGGTATVGASDAATAPGAADNAAAPTQPASPPAPDHTLLQAPDPDQARLIRATVTLDNQAQPEMAGQGGRSILRVRFEVQASPGEPEPRTAVVISSDSGRIIGSSVSPPGLFRPYGSPHDSPHDSPHQGTIDFSLPDLPLNHGRYRVGVYLLCSQARYVYAWSDPHVHIQVAHQGSHQGPWLIPGQWAAP